MESVVSFAGLTALDLVRVAVAAFLAILFLQSGIDKIVDRKGNMEWLTGHFAKSPLASLVGPMLAVITLIEIASTAPSAASVRAPVNSSTGAPTAESAPAATSISVTTASIGLTSEASGDYSRRSVGSRPPYLEPQGSSVAPISQRSHSRAAPRPSLMAQTTSD